MAVHKEDKSARSVIKHDQIMLLPSTAPQRQKTKLKIRLLCTSLHSGVLSAHRLWLQVKSYHDKLKGGGKDTPCHHALCNCCLRLGIGHSKNEPSADSSDAQPRLCPSLT